MHNAMIENMRTDALLDLYADNWSMRTMDCFLPPLLKLCMMCIEYLYHEGSETM